MQNSSFIIKAAKSPVFQCAQQGILKHAIPREYGGSDDKFGDLIEAHQKLGKSCHDPGVVLSVNAHLWGAVFPLLNYGRVNQKNEFLPDLIKGVLVGGHAITEPQSGSDLESMKGRGFATKTGYRISCHKRYITNAPNADIMIVYVRIEKNSCAFVIRSSDPGVCFSDSPAVSGCRTAAMGDVILDDCSIPDNRLLGKPGAGHFVLQHALELERAFIFAGILGVMDWQLAEVVKYSRDRMVEGKPLAHKQAIYHRIAEMKTRLDGIRLWIQHCARLKDAGQRLTLASAQTKLFASEAFLQSSLDAVQIFGAAGLANDNPMAQLVQDAMASRLFSGSSEIQKNIIATLLGTGESYRKPASR